MSTTEPSSSRRIPLGALAALVVLAGSGGCRRPADAPSGPAAPAGLELEPILWARSEVAYEDFRSERLETLHEELTPLLGEPLLFRVVPYVERDAESGRPVLEGETLEIYYQETRASVSTLRRRADRIARRVRSGFPGLDEKDHLLIHARLPDGKIVTDLDPGVTDRCGSRNAVRTDVLPSVYEPGTLEELNFVLCDGPAELDARLQDPDWPLIEDNWRTDDAAP